MHIDIIEVGHAINNEPLPEFILGFDTGRATITGLETVGDLLGKINDLLRQSRLRPLFRDRLAGQIGGLTRTGTRTVIGDKRPTAACGAIPKA